METVEQALARHEADCPVCQGNYREHCADRETDELIANLRRDVERLTAERDEALWCAEELRQTKERLADCERARDQWHDAAHRLADERDAAPKKLEAVRLNCDAVVEGLRHFAEIDGEATGMSKVAQMVLDLIGGTNV